MAWDTDKTQQLLLDAATIEFATHGFAGTRVDKIAVRAGINKERIYQYFGSKMKLFDRVIDTELQRVINDVQLTDSGPAAIGRYAAQLWHRHTTNPTLIRLLFWEGLERGREPSYPAERILHYHNKVSELAAALPGISRARAEELLLTILSLCASYVALPQLDALIIDQATKNASTRPRSIERLVTLCAQDCLTE